MKDGSTIIVNMKCKELQHNREQASYLCKTFLESSSFEDSTMTNTDHQLKKETKKFIINPRGVTVTIPQIQTRSLLKPLLRLLKKEEN